MVLMNGTGIKKMFLDETLFDNVAFNIDSGDKIGFVGVNGAGKSTLFKIITEQTDYDSGEIFKNKALKIGYLDQYACSDSENTVYEEILEAFSDVIELEHMLEDIRFDIENKNGDIDSLIMRQTRLQEEFAEREGFFYKNKAKSTLMGLGFSEEDFSLKVNKLSGGQKTRIALGKILLSDANLLLLDEPTNHLDIASVEWLESFLNGCKTAFIVISHDRYFLDRVTNKTFELENGRMRSYNGNYTAYMAQREIDRKTEVRNYENTMAEIKRLEGIVEQQKRWNRERNIKTAESKQKVIDKLEESLVKPMSAPEELEFKFKACAGGGQEVITGEDLAMSFDGKTIFQNASFKLMKGEKVFLLGPNGCGKTTLIKILMGQYKQKSGEYKLGSNIFVGYYDQIQENLDMEKTIFDELYDEYPNMTVTQIRNALAVFLFKGEEVFKEIKKLSGGERARVELAKLMLKNVNFLIMDEPTNHLDIESREALENALKDYDGTMLMVSHDRYFINKLADRIIYMEPDGLVSYGGGYDYYLEHRKTEEAQQAQVEVKSLDYKEQKRLEAQKRKIVNRFKKVEELITEAEQEIEEKSKGFEDVALATDFVKANELQKEIDAVNARIEELMAEWEELQEAIEENGYEV